MTWTSLTFAFGSVLTSTKITQLSDNITAQANGDASSPQQQTAGIANLAVTEGKLAASAVAQAKLKTTTGDVGGGGSTNYTLPGGEYGFYPRLLTSDSGHAMTASFGTVSSTSFVTNIFLDQPDGGSSASARQRYIQSSPPYESYRAGECIPLFMFALINKTTGRIIAWYVSEDPPWANNGPTITNPIGRIQQYMKSAISDIRSVDRNDYDLQLVQKITAINDAIKILPSDLLRLDVRDPAVLAEVQTAAAIDDILRSPIPQSLKNADMSLIPQPFLSFNGMKPEQFAADYQVVVIAPTDTTFARALQLRHTQLGDSIGEILHGDYMIIDNSPIDGLVTPAGVMAVRARWK